MKVLLVDLSNCYWRAYYGMRHSALRNDDGNLTFAIHGTINTLSTLVSDYQPTHVLVAMDQGQSAYRKSIYPEYKEARKTDGHEPEPESREQLDNCKLILKKMGFFVYGEPDTEADDIIAATVYRFKDDVDHIRIVSGDKDLRQLIRPNVDVLVPALGGKTGKHEELWTMATVKDHYGVDDPSELAQIWALSGDTSDGIPGIPGVGPKTAIKLYHQYGSAAAVALSSEKKVIGNEARIHQALRLIELDGLVAECAFTAEDFRWEPTKPGQAHGRELDDMLERLELQFISSRWKDGSLWRAKIPRKRLGEKTSL